MGYIYNMSIVLAVLMYTCS